MSFGGDIFGLEADDDDDDDFYSADSNSEPASSTAPEPAQTTVVERAPMRPARGAIAAKTRQLRARPMTPLMRSKHPGVVSITLTRDDGTQVVYVR